MSGSNFQAQLLTFLSCARSWTESMCTVPLMLLSTVDCAPLADQGLRRQRPRWPPFNVHGKTRQARRHEGRQRFHRQGRGFFDFVAGVEIAKAIKKRTLPKAQKSNYQLCRTAHFGKVVNTLCNDGGGWFHMTHFRHSQVTSACE